MRKGFVVLDIPRELLQFALHGYEINERGHGFLHDALRVRALDMLREVPNAQRAVARYNATRGLQRPIDYVEERRFPAAIPSHQPNAFPPANAEGEATEKFFPIKSH